MMDVMAATHEVVGARAVDVFAAGGFVGDGRTCCDGVGGRPCRPEDVVVAVAVGAAVAAKWVEQAGRE